MRRVLARILRPLCSAIEQTATAERALALLRESPPDLVMLDVHLPSQPGQTVLDEIRSNADLRLVPVVMMSGRASRDERLRAIQAGATDFISKPFDVEELVVRVRWLMQLKSFTDTLEEGHQVIVALARIVDARDPYTAGHSERVSFYAGRLAEHIGLPEQDVVVVRQGSLFHDLGKIAVRDQVLLKPDRLTDEEFAEMKRHPVVGRDLLAPMKTLARALPIVQCHHERLDGSGYPDALEGDAIALMVRLVSIADVFDGLTTARPYREALTTLEALEIIEDEARKRRLDGKLVDEFRATLEVLPRVVLASVDA